MRGTARSTDYPESTDSPGSQQGCFPASIAQEELEGETVGESIAKGVAAGQAELDRFNELCRLMVEDERNQGAMREVQ